MSAHRPYRPPAARAGGAPPEKRAEPPRPSLLLGSVAACGVELDKLQCVAAALVEDGVQGQRRGRGWGDPIARAVPPSTPSPLLSSDASRWHPLVHRFRWLRETLVSQRAATGALARAAFEAAADAALRAGDYGEFLKSVSHLAIGGGAEFGGGGGGVDARSTPASTPYAPGEADALLMLYFACVPPRPEALDAATRARAVTRAAEARGGGTGATSRSLPPPVTSALALVAAALAGDGLAFARLAGAPSCGWRARALARAAGGRAAARGLAALASAYRTIPEEAARRLLGCEGDVEVAVAAAAAAGAAWAAAPRPAGGDLRFIG